MAKSAAIGIMCKAPLPGRAKTRLAATIGGDDAARLSSCFLRDIAATVESLPKPLACQGYAVYAPAGGEPRLRDVLPPSFALLLQVDAEFGNVLHGAVEALLAAGHDCVVLINGDGPTLPPRFLVQAVESLRRLGDRMVLGPASDGGYYLIGLKRAHRRLFEGIPWGTDAVAALTRARAAEIALDVELLPEWYDVDDAETLDWLRDELAGRSRRFVGGARATSTRAFLAELTAAVK